MSEYIVPLLSLLISLGAVYLSARKQSRELDNIDADTISKLYDAIEKQEKRYDLMCEKQEERYNKLEKDFADYKLETSIELTKLRKESVTLRHIVSRLSKQLKDNHIEPEILPETIQQLETT